MTAHTVHSATGSSRRRALLSFNSWRAWSYILPALVFTTVFFLVPIAMMMWHSLVSRKAGKIQADPSLANYEKFFQKDYLIGSLINSLELTLATIAIGLPLAFALAAVIAFIVPKRWQIGALILAVLPFWTSYVVRTYSWLLLLSERGLFNRLLLEAGLVSEPLTLVNDRAGVLIVFVHYFVMIMTLTIYVSLRAIPPNIFRAARDLGASTMSVFLKVVLPMSLPGVMVGVFLTFVLGIGDYVTPQIIGGSSEMMMPQAIVLQVGRFANTPQAAALSFILMSVVIAGVLVFSRWLKVSRA
ncbi:MAG: ABC transporter permease [Pseudomonadota bacterium]